MITHESITPQKPRILFITKEFSEKSAGGAGVYAFELVKAMAAQGAIMHVLTTGKQSSTKQIMPGLTVHSYRTLNLPLLRVPIHHLKVLFHSSELIIKYKITSIHSNNFDGAFASHNVALIATIHHPAQEEIKYAPRLEKPIYYADLYFQKRVLRRASTILAVSHLTANALKPFVNSARIKILPNGIDLNEFKEKRDMSLRSGMGIKSGELMLFFSGGARGKRKGMLTFLEALNKVDRTNFKLVVSGSSREIGWSHELNRAIGNSLLKDKLILVGEIDYNDLPRYYSSSDIVVCPSTFEGFGLPALEALACGKPLICTRTGEMPYIVKNGVNGLLVEVGDAVGLMQAVNKLLSSSTERDKFANNARKSILSYSWKFTAKKVIELHKQVILEQNLGD